ncbi:Copia type Polyprotein [Phytophthora megakarya]|uniref:Copia type Polyprotein n=1 Tax=Phytophthora megakarya TaxID=4795 RepID=A0A225WUM5_9STRA|nr:Copia type Polyprotein [Phytophthora megakarya]
MYSFYTFHDLLTWSCHVSYQSKTWRNSTSIQEKTWPLLANSETCVVEYSNFRSGFKSENWQADDVWHMRFAHQNVAAMKLMAQEEMVEGMESLTFRALRGQFRCIACQCAKQKQMTCKRQEGKRQKECYARLISELCSIGILIPGGNLYVQVIQDEVSKFKWCYLLNEKSDTDKNILNVILQAEKDHVIHLFSSDRGDEFLNKNFAKFLADHGIKVLPTNSYTPEEKFLLEKLNCTLMNKVRAN